MTDMTKAAQKIEAVLADRCASYWLKNALKTAVQRDPIDAMYDAELLAEILRARTGEVLS
jgi:hypothetical protein